MSFTSTLPPWNQDQYLVMLEPCERFPAGDFQIRSGVAINVLAKNYSYARELGEFWSWMPVTEALPILKAAVVPGPATPQASFDEAKRLLEAIDSGLDRIANEAASINKLVDSLVTDLSSRQ